MTTGVLTEALRLAEEYGIRVFPARAAAETVNGKRYGAKSPLTARGFKDASTNLGEIERWFTERPDALIAVPTDRFFVIDVDPAGAEWYRANAERLACARVHRTRRGWHLLYRMPQGVRITNETGELPEGIDVRGAGGYIIWWPAHGLEATGGLEDLTEPPPWLLQCLRTPHKTNGTARSAGRNKYCEGGRHKALLREAARLRGKGLTEAQLEGALIAWNLERCSPPQEEEDVRRIARDYAEKPEDRDAALAVEDVHALNFGSMQSLQGETIAEKVPIVRDLIYPGAWLLVGRPKIGKSWLLLQLALAAAEAGSFLGFTCESCEVLCVFGEDDNARILSRLYALGVANAPPTAHVVNQRELMELAKRFAARLTFTEFLEAWLVKHPAVRLVLLDTETTVRQVWEAERESALFNTRIVETDYKQTRAFDELALRLQVAVILVNHAAKRKGEWTDIHELINRSNTALAGASGSIAIADPPDADPFDPKQKMRVLGIRGRDLENDVLLAVHQEKDMPRFVSDGEYVEARQTQAESEILEALAELMIDAGEGYVQVADIAEAVGKSRNSVKRAISRMLKAGRTRWQKSRIVAKRGKRGGLRLEPVST